MMVSKNCVCEVVEVSTALLTLISLTMHLSLILAAFYDVSTTTPGAANISFPAHLPHGLVAFSIVNQVRQVKVEHLYIRSA